MSWPLNFNPVFFLPHHNGILDYKLTLIVYLFYARHWAKHFTWVSSFNPYNNPRLPEVETEDTLPSLWLYQSIDCSLVSRLLQAHLISNTRMKKMSVVFSSGEYVHVCVYGVCV